VANWFAHHNLHPIHVPPAVSALAVFAASLAAIYSVTALLCFLIRWS
jgi:hypothetical protein